MQCISIALSFIKLNRLGSMRDSNTSFLHNHQPNPERLALSILFVALFVLTGCQREPIVDNQPPTEPTGLAVTVLSMTQIRVSWQESTDDVAVTSYRVLRNGEYIGVTNTTIFLDDTADAKMPRRYEVIAVDAANNLSSVSNPVLGRGFEAAQIPRPN